MPRYPPEAPADPSTPAVLPRLPGELACGGRGAPVEGPGAGLQRDTPTGGQVLQGMTE